MERIIRTEVLWLEKKTKGESSDTFSFLFVVALNIRTSVSRSKIQHQQDFLG